MYTIVAGTNRSNSITSKFALLYHALLKDRVEESQIFSLENLPNELLSFDVYEKGKKPKVLTEIQEKYFEPTSKFIFVFPEYNGSMPGSLKLLIDVLDPKLSFAKKKAGLVGLSTGRAGNLRGLDHLTSVLMHMDSFVMPYLLPISKIQHEIDESGLKESTLKPVLLHIERMIDF